MPQLIASLYGRAANVVLASAVMLLAAVPASAQDRSAGERIYFEKGGCNQCHGSNGDGVGDDARERGANFRKSSLDREAIIMIISCGIPGTNMPYFDKFSYTDDRCYGMTEADVGADKPQPPITTFLANRDIDAVADYIIEHFVGKGPVDPAAAKSPRATAPTH